MKRPSARTVRFAIEREFPRWLLRATGASYEKTELLYVVCFEKDSSRIKNIRLLDIGDKYRVFISIEDFRSAALAFNANRIAMVHSHVNMPLIPSEDDWDAAGQLQDALSEDGIELIDSYIIGPSMIGSVSMRALDRRGLVWER